MTRLALLAALTILVAATIPGPRERETAAVIANAAERWLDALSAEQRENAKFAFDEDERENWHFVPREYAGVALADMSLEQRRPETVGQTPTRVRAGSP